MIIMLATGHVYRRSFLSPQMSSLLKLMILN